MIVLYQVEAIKRHYVSPTLDDVTLKWNLLKQES